MELDKDLWEEQTHAEYCDILEERLCSFYIENKLSDCFKKLVEVASTRFDKFKDRKFRDYEDDLWLTLPCDPSHMWTTRFIEYFFN